MRSVQVRLMGKDVWARVVVSSPFRDVVAGDLVSVESHGAGAVFRCLSPADRVGGEPVFTLVTSLTVDDAREWFRTLCLDADLKYSRTAEIKPEAYVRHEAHVDLEARVAALETRLLKTVETLDTVIKDKVSYIAFNAMAARVNKIRRLLQSFGTV